MAADGVESGDGWAVAALDDLGEGYGFRKIRSGLGVEAFGVNGIVMPPGYETGTHFHDTQQELYIVFSGEIEISFGDGSTHRLGPGGMARVDAPVHRSVKNVGDGDAVYVCVGGKGGYVGRDGRAPRLTPRPRLRVHRFGRIANSAEIRELLVRKLVNPSSSVIDRIRTRSWRTGRSYLRS